MAAYYGWQFHTKLELAAAQIEWLVQQLGPNRPPIWVVTDGAYAKRPFLKRVLAAAMTVISRLRCDAALWSLPVVVDPGQKRGRGRPPKYGKNRIDLAKRGEDAGLADRAFLPLRSAGRQKVQDVLGDLQAGGWGDPSGAGARARSLGGVLFDRPESERRSSRRWRTARRWSRSSTTSRRCTERDSSSCVMCGPTWGRGT